MDELVPKDSHRNCKVSGNGIVPPHYHHRHSAAVTRQLRLLRAHGLIQKVPKTHRYLVTEPGRRAITALLAARNASIERLADCAA